MKTTHSFIALASVLGLTFSLPLYAGPVTSKNPNHSQTQTFMKGGMDHCPMASQGMMGGHMAMMGQRMGSMNPHGIHRGTTPAETAPTTDTSGGSSVHDDL
jgi:hypothetical protein